MTAVNRASYHSPRRQQAATATRDAILGAAQDLFATQGYARTTVAQIAAAAQVAANTVYTSVGGKPQLLAAIMQDGTSDPAITATLTAAAQTTDPAEVIRLTAAGSRQVNERHAKGITVLLDSAQADPGAVMAGRGIRQARRSYPVRPGGAAPWPPGCGGSSRTRAPASERRSRHRPCRRCRTSAAAQTRTTAS
jgi:AcrR family transcriptional regulator